MLVSIDGNRTRSEDKLEVPLIWIYNNCMKNKARVNKEGFMNSGVRVHRVRKGKGSFNRKLKHKKEIC